MISEYGQDCKVDFDGLRVLAGTRKRLRNVVEWRERGKMETVNMDKKVWKMVCGAAVLLLTLLCIPGSFTACGREPEAEATEWSAIPSESSRNPAGEGAEEAKGAEEAEEAEGAEGADVTEEADSKDRAEGASTTSEEGLPLFPEETSAAREDIAAGETEKSETASQAAGTGQAAGTNQTDALNTPPMELDAMQKMFGKDCISEQTFEVQLSEYAQKVYFVPFAPSEENPGFRMQLIRDGQVLRELPAYVPEQLAGSEFTSLDAVAFRDVNFEGSTDILLLETYGNTSFAAIYFGEGKDTREYNRVHFWVEEELSEYLTDQVEPLTFSGISDFLTGGKKNGEFAGYQEAYAAVGKVYELFGKNRTFNLIYFDGDDIPELVAGIDGYFMSLFTYDAGRVYCLMNDWGYGAMGNAGYEYAPRKNSLRNYDADFAGAIMYTTYMTIGEQHSLERVVSIETFNFNDMNGDGYPNDDELESADFESVSYIDGVAVTEEECASYDAGGYEYIEGGMSLEELMNRLGR